MKTSGETRFRFADLFAGVGGLRIPFEESPLNGECVFSSEKDPAARETYKSNFLLNDRSTDHVFNEDITDYFDPAEAGLKFVEIPDHDLLLAGFPCQPFSMAGKRLGKGDERALFSAIFETMKYKTPKVALLENVRGLMSIDSGNTYREILHALESLGYLVPEPKVLNARDFGLPQNRNRLFIVALRDDVARNHKFEWPIPTHARDSLTVGEILDSNPDPKLTISDRLWSGHQRRKLQNQANGKGFGYQIVTNTSSYTATLSARYYKDGSEILVAQDGANPRLLSVSEAARLQGFPKSFIPHSSQKQAYKQFGNAVPVNVVRAIAKNLQPLLSDTL